MEKASDIINELMSRKEFRRKRESKNKKQTKS